MRRTGDIGAFVLLGDSASSAGVRRIEALTGEAALRHLAEQEPAPRAKSRARSRRSPAEVVDAGPGADRGTPGAAERGGAAAPRAGHGGGAGAPAPEAREVGGVAFVSQVLTGVSGKDLPALIDEQKARLGSGAVLLIADAGGKAAVAAGVTADLTERVSAVDLVRAAVGGAGRQGRRRPARHGAGRRARRWPNAEAAIAAAARILEG